ncbi:hypothetical protein JCM9152_4425 [Halalkalibacter hemicellulosilyticusJCM 9152]|uniref:Uncharacterized protein n=1 Tax=Halalkalibacter hemicellulosilyticusJCM 9152 TaxID=1236971 RepID=W4QL45_9BACI|nr:hypothetical protein JCM9152_4425 [Halalkalibacter hemicellulosilyticusJCM 9152]
MNYSLLQKGLPPLIIKGENKIEYINILANENVEQFCQFSSEVLQREAERLESFMNMERNEIKDVELKGPIVKEDMERS